MPKTLICFIGLGSNLGDRAAYLKRALEMLARSEGVELLAASSVYESPAWGYESESPFLNAVAKLEYDGTPLGLLALCYRIEAALDRHPQRSVEGSSIKVPRYADRTIDLDLLYIEDVSLQHARLTLPHPRAHLRAFVLVPWQEIEPGQLLKGRTLTGWTADLPRSEVRELQVRHDITLAVPDEG